jgi:hypothetical protein
MFELKGKTALVTGAAKRVGKAISIGLAEQGINLVIHYCKSKKEAEALKDDVAKLGVKSWLVRADFSDPSSSRRLIERSYELSGGLDILINNASVFSTEDMRDAKLVDINVDMLANAWTPFMLSMCFSERTKYGRIINLLDTRIAGYDFNHFAYYISKKMLETLTKSMALRLAPNITVNGLAPGLILPPIGESATYLEQRKDTVPLKKYGSTVEVLDAVLFLLRNDFVTGQIIYVDGGKHLIQTVEGL